MIIINKDQFLKILEFNKTNKEKIRRATNDFYLRSGMKEDSLIPNIMLTIKTALKSDHGVVLEMPLKSKEIGAIYRKIDNRVYIILNTSLPQANNNFALVHELYHYYNSDMVERGIKTDAYVSCYDSNEDDMMANAFAGNILMPEDVFTRAYQKSIPLTEEYTRICKESNMSEEDTAIVTRVSPVISMMVMFGTTYMSVLIRACELGFIRKDEPFLEAILEYNDETKLNDVFERFSRASGVDYTYILKATRHNDFISVKEKIKHQLIRNVENELISESFMKNNLREIEETYEKLVSLNGEGL